MAAPRPRSVKDMARLGRPPLRFGDDPLLLASWLYYEEGLTQSEIADQLGASRPTVNAYLADARSSGIVNISISAPRLRALSIARAIEEHFGIDDCLVVPGEGGERSIFDRLGGAGALAVKSVIHSGDIIGISWGRTMLALANAVRDIHVIDVTVVQSTGGTTAAINYTPEACATRLAERLNASFVPISAPAIVSSPEAKRMLEREPVIAEQLQNLQRLDRIFFGVSSLRPSSTIYNSGFFDSHLQQVYAGAVGSMLGRIIDAQGNEVDGPLRDRTIGLDLDQLRKVPTRVLIAGGYDKVPPILAALHGGAVTTLVTDVATAEGILRADGVAVEKIGVRRASATPARSDLLRSRIKKFLNSPKDAVNEALEGAFAAFPDHIEPIDGSPRAIRARAAKPAGKVGVVIGGGAGHEPSFLGFVGPGLADAVAVGNVFASPPPDRVLACTRDAHRGAGVLYVYGNYTGDVMNFDMAADLAGAEGIEVRTVLTSDDIASAAHDDRAARRGTAGNVFVFKIAGAASARMYGLAECERLARKANDACHTIGVAMESCSMPDTQRPSFKIGEDDMEFGVGVHGEPGVTRVPIESADRIVDQICDRIFAEMQPRPGDRVAVLVNSLGGTPMMELLILNRRLRKRLEAREIAVHSTLVGHYCTSLDMIGASITLMKLDDELTGLLDDPCDGFAWSFSGRRPS
ncbi:bifunctional sugar-binding transcriptional regulator/dihydroxyacetone kinase subunit DhaK [Rhodobacter ferrooxidans]|uniref:Glycerone kinase n=1 Tax=Rhodobacter ferrooxidans TaxID=371731 RepID=C8RYK1_9RHOB|nr:bifunctional sugar-binding transcriptional regulator/dihydroxyacetone kinase subunit DhaK [Rhodobacter sp. SW2]EEW26189.1 Glycerone kinase [Rhodobacter sp. SW2]